MHLYEITKQLNELMAMEDIPREQIEDTINLIEEEFEGKAEMVAAYIRELEADEAGLKSEIDRLSERKRVLVSKIDNLKDYLRQNMMASGKTNIKGKLFSITDNNILYFFYAAIKHKNLSPFRVAARRQDDHAR
jgi:predicted nuclease with TOPRIM domain